MLIVEKKVYKKHFVSGSGIFDDVNNLYNRAKSSDFFRALSGMKTMLTNRLRDK